MGVKLWKLVLLNRFLPNPNILIPKPYSRQHPYSLDVRCVTFVVFDAVGKGVSTNVIAVGGVSNGAVVVDGDIAVEGICVDCNGAGVDGTVGIAIVV